LALKIEYNCGTSDKETRFQEIRTEIESTGFSNKIRQYQCDELLCYISRLEIPSVADPGFHWPPIPAP
jgi:hypothetical protein